MRMFMGNERGVKEGRTNQELSGSYRNPIKMVSCGFEPVNGVVIQM